MAAPAQINDHIATCPRPLPDVVELGWTTSDIPTTPGEVAIYITQPVR